MLPQQRSTRTHRTPAPPHSLALTCTCSTFQTQKLWAHAIRRDRIGQNPKRKYILGGGECDTGQRTKIYIGLPTQQ